jgi:Spy/CpxP family protein refolding chaperone
MIAIARFGLLLALVTSPAWAEDAAPATTTLSLSDSVAELQAFQAEVGDAKREFVDHHLQLTEQEAAKFWPIFDEHQTSLSVLNRRRLENIHAFAALFNAGSTDKAAGEAVAKEALAIEADEAKLMQRTFGKLKKVLPIMKTIRYLQFESKLRAIVRFELAAEIPYAQP